MVEDTPLLKFLHISSIVERGEVAQALGSIGLSRMEAEVYLYVSSNPETTAGEVTKKLRIARSKTYEALDKLASMGLLSKISKEEVNRYYSSGSSILKGLYMKQMEDAQNAVDYIQKMALTRPSAKTSGARVRIVEGIEEYKTVKEAFLSTLIAGEEVLIIGSPASLDEKIVDYFEKFHRKRIAKNVKLRIIYNADVAGARLERAVGWKDTEVRCLPKNNSPAWIEIFGGRALISLASPGNIITIAITDDSVAESFRNYFELMWKNTKKAEKKRKMRQ